jgi:hypothetical protein
MGLAGAHLDHEKADGLALIDATVTEEQWQAFGAEGGRRIAGDAWRYVPWMLEGATPEVTAAVLGRSPRRCSRPTVTSGSRPTPS